jgi:hypothetical protein
MYEPYKQEAVTYCSHTERLLYEQGGHKLLLLENRRTFTFTHWNGPTEK